MRGKKTHAQDRWHEATFWNNLSMINKQKLGRKVLIDVYTDRVKKHKHYTFLKYVKIKSESKSYLVQIWSTLYYWGHILLKLWSLSRSLLVHRNFNQHGRANYEGKIACHDMMFYSKIIWSSSLSSSSKPYVPIIWSAT